MISSVSGNGNANIGPQVVGKVTCRGRLAVAILLKVQGLQAVTSTDRIRGLGRRGSSLPPPPVVAVTSDRLDGGSKNKRGEVVLHDVRIEYAQSEEYKRQAGRLLFRFHFESRIRKIVRMLDRWLESESFLSSGFECQDTNGLRVIAGSSMNGITISLMKWRGRIISLADTVVAFARC